VIDDLTTSELPAGEPKGRPRRYTSEEFLRMVELGAIGRREYLWNGEIVEAMSKKRSHRNVEAGLQRLLWDIFPADQWSVLPEAPLVLPNGRVPQPDLMLLAGGFAAYAGKDIEPADVAVVIEVGDATYAADAGEVLRAYAEAGLALYWIVNVAGRQVEVYSDPDPTRGRYGTVYIHRAGEVLTLLGRRIAVDDIFRYLPA